MSGSIMNDIQKSNLKLVFVYGRPLSGQSTVAKILNKKFGFKVLDWPTFTEQVKKAKSTDEEPFEGEVPSYEVANAIFDFLSRLSKEQQNQTYVLDGYYEP